MEVPTEDHALSRALSEFPIRTLLAQGGSGIFCDVAQGSRCVALKGLEGLQTIQHSAVVKVFGAIGALYDQGLIHRDLNRRTCFVVGGQHPCCSIRHREGACRARVDDDDGRRRTSTSACMAFEWFFGQPASVATDLRVCMSSQ